VLFLERWELLLCCHFVLNGMARLTKIHHAIGAQFFFKRDELTTGEAIEEHVDTG
jgi:hypothetical protein